MASERAFSPFLKRLTRGCDLDPSEVGAVLALPHHLRELGPNTDIVRQGEQPSQCCLVVEGMLCRFKLGEAGSRQIVSLHLPGDMPDLQTLYLDRNDCYLATLERSTVAFLPHLELRRLVVDYPRLAHLLWRETLIEAAVSREWTVNVGRRNAHSRIAHLICELAVRLKEIGQGEETSLRWSLTQANLADVTGLSIVHVNRILQSLRHEGMIELCSGTLKIRDWQALVEVADFSSEYLYLE